MHQPMSALRLKADMFSVELDVCFVPIPDSCTAQKSRRADGPYACRRGPPASSGRPRRLQISSRKHLGFTSKSALLFVAGIEDRRARESATARQRSPMPESRRERTPRVTSDKGLQQGKILRSCGGRVPCFSKRIPCSVD